METYNGNHLILVEGNSMTTQSENAMPTSTLNHHACLEWFRVLKINTYFCDSHVGISLKKWFCFVILTHHPFFIDGKSPNNKWKK
jgi:hypothetical protein